MKFRLSNNFNDIGFEMEAEKSELQSHEQIDALKDQMTAAYEAADAVWKAHPEFKTVTLDTMSVEDHMMMDQVKNRSAKGGEAGAAAGCAK